MQIKTALISVYDKTGVVELAKRLKNVKILSTGGTAKLLRENGVEIVDVSEYTGSDEIMDGRVKTLHPKIYAGLLAKRDDKKHMDELKKLGIDPIDLVVVNLYPFEETVASNPSMQEAVEKIDIGGPTMIRAAAKNFISVAVDPADYSKIDVNVSDDVIKELVVKAFSRAADYNSSIEKYLGKELEGKNYFRASFIDGVEMRYGENPHQKAMFFKAKNVKETSVPYGTQLNGKQLSYNNILDTDSALGIAKEFSEPTVAIIKHLNPCGVACGSSIAEAYKKALECDSVSAFGSVVGMNKVCDKETAEEISKVFTEVV
ncbi:bifunctional phosphoribosylaminoimidazolecarboxamide formyltransferase/IMP cyclohydrolase, partial [Candidatus Woesearchaeota archaeon]|nr:bifunctional phosphoribosylaminoimidazolecarboxamide formyltransferase/IMP cyclohydrolase [Candidatus Woesearchaeota archaeon]